MVTNLPMPTLDHVVVNVRDRIDAGLETYRRLGFTMTPRGYHTLGSMNHLAILGSEYLELIAAAPGETRRAEILAAPFGLNGLVFGTENSAGVYAALREAGVPVEPPLEFSRPVELAEGSRDATFRTVHFTPGTVPAGRVYFCHHLHARSGVAGRMAAPRQRCDRHRACRDRRARTGGAGRAVRADVRRGRGAALRHRLLARGRAVAVRRDHAGCAVTRVCRCGAGGGWTRRSSWPRSPSAPVRWSLRCGRTGGRADQRRPAGGGSHRRARHRDLRRNA